MEALLEKEGNVESWNDDRLDELSQTMKEGFARVDKRFEQVDQRFIGLEGQIKEGFERLDDRIFKVMILMLVFCGGLLSTLLVALLGVGGS
jgi:hypothetical protein